jgi:hypothetical protein
MFIRQLILPVNAMSVTINAYIPNTANGTARVCQNHVGEFACGDPARHFLILLAIGGLRVSSCSHVFRAVLPLLELIASPFLLVSYSEESHK